MARVSGGVSSVEMLPLLPPCTLITRCHYIILLYIPFGHKYVAPLYCPLGHTY